MGRGPVTHAPSAWLLMIHQLPPKPAYFRVKVWRQLQGKGAVALKNSVYALPLSEETREDFQWMLRQIIAGGGEASVVEAQFVEGLTDGELRKRYSDLQAIDFFGAPGGAEVRTQLTHLESRLVPKPLDPGRGGGRHDTVGWPTRCVYQVGFSCSDGTASDGSGWS